MFRPGEFNEEGLREDIDGLDASQVLGIVEWGEFMRKTYQFEGVTPGLYFDETGAPTELYLKAQELAEEGRRLRAEDKDEQQRLPTCNSKWTQHEGGEVWCSKDSGGVQRDWVRTLCVCVCFWGSWHWRYRSVWRGVADCPRFPPA
jgi:hypothetical protein